MVNIRKLIAVVLVAAASLLIGIQYLRLVGPATAREFRAACAGMHSADHSPTIGAITSGTTPAPNFTAQDYQGRSVSLSDFRGRPVLVNFWASWCTTCAAEKPSMQALQRDLGDDLVVLSLASDVGWDGIREKFPNGTPLTILLDRPEEEGTIGPIARAYGVTAVPESFLVDKRGMLRYYFINKRDWQSGIAETCLRSVTDE
jgi:thiol-disulfide isomerase/thioredoxin